MKLLMCSQEAGTHKDHQKALSYLALWQGSAHQTVPCRSTMIRKAAGKQSICKVSAQLTSMHLDPYQRCFCISGICVCLQHFSNTHRGSQAGQLTIELIRGAGLSLGTILLRLPHTEWAKCRTIVHTGHTGWNAGSWNSSVPWSSSHTHNHSITETGSCTRLGVLTSSRMHQGQQNQPPQTRETAARTVGLRQGQANPQTGTHVKILFGWYIGGIPVAFANS